MRPEGPLPGEIGFLSRRGWPLHMLQAAAKTAALAGVPASDILLKSGDVSEEEFYRALAEELGLHFVANPRLSRYATFPESVLSGVAPLAGSRARFALAPGGATIAGLLATRTRFGPQAVITTPSAMRDAVFELQAAHIASQAAHGLPANTPELSIRDGGTPLQIAGLAVLVGMLCFLGPLFPNVVLGTATTVLAPLFMSMVALRLATVVVPTAPRVDLHPRQPDIELPIYSVIVALHRERRVVARLVEALRGLDYPAAKLDIILVIEADDTETAEALASIALPGCVQILVAPAGHPRTKPRALNVALPLARGKYTVIYDAEDVPDPGQLRLAVATFAHQPAHVACLQARLTIDNSDDSWITRLFTIEYASLFDVLNPGLAALRGPIPLGGTSNHFRTAVLKEICGWDAWNVTEDADLGIRLARLGYVTGDLASSTLEEAPATLNAWMRQRVRWMKGFMQTCTTHSRQPLVVFRQLGPARFLVAVAMTFGTVLTALGYPTFAVVSLIVLVRGPPPESAGSIGTVGYVLGVGLLVLGLLAVAVQAGVALRRRRLQRLMPQIVLLPFYYGLVSAAAWWALWELAFDPFRWNKTEHGLARTSRSSQSWQILENQSI